MSVVRARHWSPYAVGSGIGVLSWFAFATAGRGLGITTPFEHSAALVLAAIVPAGDAMRSYLAAHAPRIGWEWMLVIGVALGSHVSARLSGDRRHAVVPALWRERFGDSPALRMGVAFAGGAIMMIGARLARGCTSGHGITGALQLAVASWLFIAVAFAVAIATAALLYRRWPRLRVGAAR